MIEAGLFNLVSTTPAVAAICETRIYPLILPTGSKYPAATYQMISANPDPTLDTSGFQRWRIQYDCFGRTYADASGLRRALITALNGYVGVLSDGTHLQNAEFHNLTDFFNDASRTYRCMVEFHLYFTFNG